MLVSVVLTSSRVLSGIFCCCFFLGGGGDFEPRGGEKKFLSILEGSGGMLPQKILKIYCSGLAEIAFLDVSNLH